MNRPLNSNPYYHPEGCGLTIIGQLEDPNADYSYDTIVVWFDIETSNVYAAHDAGCSCPTPFEDYQKLDDLTELHHADDLRSLIEQHGSIWLQADVEDLMGKLTLSIGAKKQ